MIEVVRKLPAVALFVLALSWPPLAGELAKTLPEAIPSLEGWEKITGEADLEDPPRSVRYEFYVNPKRLGLYEVVRYRIRHPRSPESGRDTEKLQWDVDGATLRRFECSPTDGPPHGECRWTELPRGSPEYERELGPILWLLGLHRRLLQERDQGTLQPPH